MMPQDLHKHFVLPQIRAYLDMVTRSYHPPFVNKPEQTTMHTPDPNLFPGAKLKISRTWTCCDACKRQHRTLIAARLHSWSIRARAAIWRRAPLWLVTFWLKLQLFLYAVANPRK